MTEHNDQKQTEKREREKEREETEIDKSVCDYRWIINRGNQG